MNTGIYDKNGIEVKDGDLIRESHSTKRFGREFDIAFGTVRYVMGCHVLDLGKLGTYTFYERHPEDDGIQTRTWEIQEREA